MSCRILVIDDETTIRHVLKQILSKQGCEIREAGCADEALAQLEGWEPEVVLLDIAMPGMSGLELLVELRRLVPSAAVVMMTSYSSVETIQRAIRGGAHDFLPKPFPVPDVWPMVQRALDKRGVVANSAAPLPAEPEPSRSV